MTTATPRMVAILQSSYIPWKGYFDILAACDEFVIFDEVQYTRRDWRNRNRVIVNRAPQWLTIPVASKGHYEAAIEEMYVADSSWASKHWHTLRHAYGKSPFFNTYSSVIADAYQGAGGMSRLSEVNVHFLKVLSSLLQIKTNLSFSSDIPRTSTTATSRLVEICRHLNASFYLSGPAAKAYIDPDEFSAAGIKLFYANYVGYPEYEQGTVGFEHGVSIIDTIFRCGPEARDHLKSIRLPSSFLEAS